MLSRTPVGPWQCFDCGYAISIREKLFGTLWFCDNCDTYMNVQSGFNTKNGHWKCSECGFENDVSSKNIF